MSEEQWQPSEDEEPLPLTGGEAPTVADMPPDLGDPGVADFPDPAWDDTTDEEGETPEPDEPEDDDEDDEVDEPDDEESPTVPPGITDADVLEPVDEPDDYDPEE